MRDYDYGRGSASITDMVHQRLQDRAHYSVPLQIQLCKPLEKRAGLGSRWAEHRVETNRRITFEMVQRFLS
jgi:hypothetical protein